MIKTKKRNHYLPRFYLKGFCDSNSRVWMYDKTNPMHPVDGAPGDMGLVKKLYHLENNENAKDEIENYFEKTVETPASPAFKRLLNKEFPNKTDKQKLSLFFGMLMVRTPVYIDSLRMQHSQELNTRAKAGASNKNYFHSVYKKIHPELDETAIEKDRDYILNNEISVENKDYTLATMVMLGLEIAPLLQKMKWVLIETNKELPFITSDNFIHVSHPTLSTGFYGLSLAMRDVCVYMPLSKNLSLLMVNRNNFNENVVYDINNPPNLNGNKINLKELIESYNKKIFCECKKYVFADSDSEELKTCFNDLLNKAKLIEDNLK